MKDRIVKWIKDYATKHDKDSLIVGVSGGIDSSVVSTLCAETGITTIPVVLSINSEDVLAVDHIRWLDDNYTNIDWMNINVENIFREFVDVAKVLDADSELGFANSRSRIRMALLYQIAQSNNGLVIGTGNKVEDFGVGFFTKYGDGGVDISPIADLYKSEVYKLGTSLGILSSIFSAAPTDGLWDDGRTDEDQLGLTYDQLEDAMKRGKASEHYERYNELRAANLHKMEPIPVYRFHRNRNAMSTASAEALGS
jgi:NAD+ synthase